RHRGLKRSNCRFGSGAGLDLTRRLDDRDAGGRGSRCEPYESWIIGNFDAPCIRAEPGAKVERESVRMVEGTGVNPEAPDRLRPGTRDRAVHEPPAGAPPLNRLGE